MTIENPNLDAAHPEIVKGLRLKKTAAIASISIAGILVATKLIAYMITDSVSMMSSFMDSTFDMIASSLTMFSIIRAALPADKKHRFGHGKVESLAAIGQAIFILASAGYLFIESMHRFVHPQKIAAIGFGIYVMLLSIVLTIGLITFQYYVIKQTKSVAVKADHLHYKGDLLMNIGVIGSFVVSHYFNWLYFDPLFATFIAFILLYSSYEIAKESFGILIDKELPEEDREKIKAIVRSHKDVCAIHDLRTRYSGHQMFIEFHLEVQGDISLKKSHDITEEIEVKIYEAFPKSEVMIHQEPCGIKDHRLDNKL